MVLLRFFLHEKLMVISEEAQVQSYIREKIYLPVVNRFCESHLIKNRIFEDLSFLKIHSKTTILSASALSKIMGFK